MKKVSLSVMCQEETRDFLQKTAKDWKISVSRLTDILLRAMIPKVEKGSFKKPAYVD